MPSDSQGASASASSSSVALSPIDTSFSLTGEPSPRLRRGGAAARSNPHPLASGPSSAVTGNSSPTSSAYSAGDKGRGTGVSALAVEDITRPKLARKTTETRESLLSTEPGRASGESNRAGGEGFSGKDGLRASVDLLRKGKEVEDGVDVLVHPVQSTDTLPKIALLYGIELAILRKANKLWTSDTIHLRKTINIPLEACRLRETVIPGPGENEVTLIKTETASAPTPLPRRGGAGGVHAHTRARTILGSEDDFSNNDEGSEDGGGPSRCGRSSSSFGGRRSMDGLDPASSFLRGTSMLYASHSPVPIPVDISSSCEPPPSPTQPTTSQRVLSLVRIPASELSFFPRSAPASTRSSIEISSSSKFALSPASPFDSATLSRSSSSGGKGKARTPPPPTAYRSNLTSSSASVAQSHLRPKRSSPSLSLTSRLSNLFVDPSTSILAAPLPLPLPRVNRGSGSASPDLLRPGPPPRQRSASDNGYLGSLVAKPAIPDVELDGFTSPASASSSSSLKRPDWFAAPKPSTVVSAPPAPTRPMLVNGKNSGGEDRGALFIDGKDRRAGDGLGNGTVPDVLI